jgi:hypothetical protein
MLMKDSARVILTLKEETRWRDRVIAHPRRRLQQRIAFQLHDTQRMSTQYTFISKINNLRIILKEGRWVQRKINLCNVIVMP